MEYQNHIRDRRLKNLSDTKTGKKYNSLAWLPQDGGYLALWWQWPHTNYHLIPEMYSKKHQAGLLAILGFRFFLHPLWTQPTQCPHNCSPACMENHSFCSAQCCPVTSQLNSTQFLLSEPWLSSGLSNNLLPKNGLGSLFININLWLPCHILILLTSLSHTHSLNCTYSQVGMKTYYVIWEILLLIKIWIKETGFSLTRLLRECYWNHWASQIYG